LPQLDAQTIAIRAATPSDAPAIGRIHVESWRETYRGVLPDRLLQSLSAVVRAAMWQGAAEREPPVLLFVAQRVSGDLVGFVGGGPCRVTSLPHDAEVYAIYLLRAVQQRGCGRRLMAVLAAALHARGFRSVCLWVLRENAFDEIAYGWASLELLCSATADLREDR
jgi:L-amino acid N-acyltransferase YncA